MKLWLVARCGMESQSAPAKGGVTCIRKPADLAKHHIIAFSNFGLDAWSFVPAKGSSIPRTVQFVPRCTAGRALMSAFDPKRTWMWDRLSVTSGTILDPKM
jgi:hypothetical protein